MNSFEKLVYELSPIKMYNFENSNTLISKEIETYANALDKIDNGLDYLLNEMFLKTCSENGMKRFSCLYGAEKFSLADMKRYISAILAGNFGCWNKSAWDIEREDILSAVFSANAVNKTFSVNNFASLSAEDKIEVVNLIRKYIACHLKLKIYIGFRTWNQIESAQLSFNNLERLGLTFSEVELYD